MVAATVMLRQQPRRLPLREHRRQRVAERLAVPEDMRVRQGDLAREAIPRPREAACCEVEDLRGRELEEGVYYGGVDGVVGQSVPRADAAVEIVVAAGAAAEWIYACGSEAEVLCLVQSDASVLSRLSDIKIKHYKLQRLLTFSIMTCSVDGHMCVCTIDTAVCHRSLSWHSSALESRLIHLHRTSGDPSPGIAHAGRGSPSP